MRAAPTSHSSTSTIPRPAREGACDPQQAEAPTMMAINALGDLLARAAGTDPGKEGERQVIRRSASSQASSSG